MKFRLSSLFSALALIFTTLLLGACWGYGPWEGIRGEGKTVSRQLNLNEFSGIVVHNACDVTIQQGSSQKARVEAQENILENLSMDVEGKILHIRNKKPVWQSDPIRLFVTMDELEVAKISGSGSIVSEDFFRGRGHLETAISGSGDIRILTETDRISGRISGSGSIVIQGQCNEAEFTIAGSGSINASELQCDEAGVQISGSGNIKVHALDYLDARISGSGDVFYTGRPKINSSISGSGNLISR